MRKFEIEELRKALRHVFYELWMLFSIGLKILEEMDLEDGDQKDDEKGEDSIAYSSHTHTSPPPQVSYWLVPRQIDVVAHNSQVEAFGVHSRALLEFFFSEKFRTRETNILAENFFESEEAWRKIRVREWDDKLENIRSRVGQEIAHITSFRMAYPIQDKMWPIEAILLEIAMLAQRFLGSVPDQFKPASWSLDEEIDEILGSA